MKDNLNKEEREILESFERGEWKSVPDLKKRKSELRDYAKATLKKNKKVSIRISERDFQELHRQAVHEGLDYQTLISSILHKYVNGTLQESTSEKNQ